MIAYSVFYPYKKDAFFNMDYYQKKHLGIIKRYFGSSCKGILVLEGNYENNKEPHFTCVCHIFFNSKKEFLDIMQEAKSELLADVKNYTNIKPFGEIKEISMQE